MTVHNELSVELSVEGTKSAVMGIVRNRLHYQTLQTFKCGKCSWTTQFIYDSAILPKRWTAHPDHCPVCNGSIYCVESKQPGVVSQVIAWDTCEVVNIGEPEYWSRLIGAF
jgi:hypothetical protein